jgi:hypothetical protein
MLDRANVRSRVALRGIDAKLLEPRPRRVPPYLGRQCSRAEPLAMCGSVVGDDGGREWLGDGDANHVIARARG